MFMSLTSHSECVTECDSRDNTYLLCLCHWQDIGECVTYWLLRPHLCVNKTNRDYVAIIIKPLANSCSPKFLTTVSVHISVCFQARLQNLTITDDWLLNITDDWLLNIIAVWELHMCSYTLCQARFVLPGIFHGKHSRGQPVPQTVCMQSWQMQINLLMTKIYSDRL